MREANLQTLGILVHTVTNIYDDMGNRTEARTGVLPVAVTTSHTRRDEKDFTKYSFQNQTYNKRNLVLAVVKALLQKSPSQTSDSLDKLFPDEISVFRPIEEAEEIFQKKKIRRHFLDEEDIITTSDNRRVVVSNQWSKRKIDIFREAAGKMGLSISEIL